MPIAIDFPGATNAEKALIRDAWAWEHNYQPTIEMPDGSTVPNPESKGQFAMRMMKRHMVIKPVKRYQDAIETLAATANINNPPIDSEN